LDCCCYPHFAADVIWLGLNFQALFTSFQPSLQLQKIFGITVLSLVGSVGTYALLNGVKFVRTRFVTVKLKKLPPKLDGLRIAHITDIHIGAMLGGDWLQRIVDRVNKLDADIVAITGDLVDGSVAELQAHVAPLAKLKAKHGVFFVTGNHEYYSGAAQWCEHVQSLGIEVLRNRHVSINAADTSIDVAGVDDWSSRHFSGGHNLAKAVAGRDETKPLILLAHQPITMHEAASHHVDLQLSGHTHGGQIWPFNYLVYLQQPVSQGLFHYPNSDLQVYVSPGTGFWGPPMRLGTVAEISCITLRCV
jgi:predicted MPP superfamily phosphohydrolase